MPARSADFRILSPRQRIEVRVRGWHETLFGAWGKPRTLTPAPSQRERGKKREQKQRYCFFFGPIIMTI
jgi:hypothetical protein